MKEFDLIIIGGGRASNLALTASKKGKKVALIEKSKLGGTCPNRGCVPSKLLIGYAHVARAIKESNRHFIDSSINSIDIKKIFEETNNYISKVDPRYESRFNENVTLYKDVGSFVSNNIVKVGDEQITAPKIVIATGTRPIKPDYENAWTSDDIFPLDINNIPKSITIVGSGFIACELANFFDAIGIKTKLLIRSQRILGNEDFQISSIFKEEFSKNIDISFDTTIKSAKFDGTKFDLILKKSSTEELIRHESEALLYATGREANSDTLNLENTSIEVNERGYIKEISFLKLLQKEFMQWEMQQENTCYNMQLHMK